MTNQHGQAFVEFILFAGLASLLFSAVLFFGIYGKKAVDAEITARNSAMSRKAGANRSRFTAYLNETPERLRFAVRYQARFFPGDLSFGTLEGRSNAEIPKKAFPSLLTRNFASHAFFDIDRPVSVVQAVSIDSTADVLYKDLFGTFRDATP